MNIFNSIQAILLWLFPQPTIEQLTFRKVIYPNAILLGVKTRIYGVVHWRAGNDSVSCIWLIKHKTSQKYFGIAVINLGLWKQSVKEQSDTKNVPKYLSNWEKDIHLATIEVILNQRTIQGSHVVHVFWLNQLSNKIDIEITDSILGDFGYGNDLRIKKIIKQILHKLASSFYIKGANLDWENIVRTIELKQWLIIFSQNEFGDAHVLQPPKLFEPKKRGDYDFGDIYY